MPCCKPWTSYEALASQEFVGHVDIRRLSHFKSSVNIPSNDPLLEVSGTLRPYLMWVLEKRGPTIERMRKMQTNADDITVRYDPPPNALHRRGPTACCASMKASQSLVG